MASTNKSLAQMSKTPDHKRRYDERFGYLTGPRVREKPLFCIDPDNGDVYLHPELARELGKPEHRDLCFEIGSMARNGAAGRKARGEHNAS